MNYILMECANLAKEFEGLHDLKDDGLVYAYHDPAGYPTIGYGHLLSYVKYEDLSKYEPKTLDECLNDLAEEMKKSMDLAVKMSPCLIEDENKYRLIAITDFVFNCGQGNYAMSTLRKRVNELKWLEASNEILKWDKAGGKVLKGLTRRRMAESKLLVKISV